MPSGGGEAPAGGVDAGSRDQPARYGAPQRDVHIRAPAQVAHCGEAGQEGLFREADTPVRVVGRIQPEGLYVGLVAVLAGEMHVTVDQPGHAGVCTEIHDRVPAGSGDEALLDSLDGGSVDDHAHFREDITRTDVDEPPAVEDRRGEPRGRPEAGGKDGTSE